MRLYSRAILGNNRVAKCSGTQARLANEALLNPISPEVITMIAFLIFELPLCQCGILTQFLNFFQDT